MAKEKDNAWKQAFEMSFGDEQTSAKLAKRTIFKEARDAGLDQTQALLLARLEAFTIAAVGSFATEAQNNIVAVGMQLHNDLNERTGYIAREVGRLWQNAGRPSLGATVWNAAAGSAIGQRLGLQPFAPPPAAPPPWNPMPKPADPHADATHPPAIAIATGMTSLGYTLAVDTTVPLTDRSGAIILTNASGGALQMTGGADLFSITYHLPYSVRPIVYAYAETNAGSATAGLIGTCTAKTGGTTTAATIQSIVASSSTLANGGTVKIRWLIVDAIPSS